MKKPVTFRRLAVWGLLVIAVLSVLAGAFNGLAVWHVATQTNAPSVVALFEGGVAFLLTTLFYFAWGCLASVVFGGGLLVCAVAFFSNNSGKNGKNGKNGSGDSVNAGDAADPDAPKPLPQDAL